MPGVVVLLLPARLGHAVRCVIVLDVLHSCAIPSAAGAAVATATSPGNSLSVIGPAKALSPLDDTRSYL